MNKNYIYMAITGILIIIFIVMYVGFGKENKFEDAEFEKRVEEYSQRLKEEKARAEEEKARADEILAETPGIACWGDGFTYGTYGDGTSYPNKLGELLEEEGYPYEVSNMGVYGEDSRTVLGRCGALPFVVKSDFTIDGNGELIKIDIVSEDGNEVNPCIQDYNPGFNPCVVEGVKCTIYGETTSENIYKANAYYLSRGDNSTESVEVKAGTQIITSGSKDYKKHINILQIGDGGGYSTDTELIEQTERFVNSLDGSQKYIIIGRLTGDDADNEAYDKAMEAKYGNHYINARKIMCGYEVENVVYSQVDKAEAEKGSIPECLAKNGYLNEAGYNELGKIVFSRLEELELLNK